MFLFFVMVVCDLITHASGLQKLSYRNICTCTFKYSSGVYRGAPQSRRGADGTRYLRVFIDLDEYLAKSIGTVTASLSCPPRSKHQIYRTDDYGDGSNGKQSVSERKEPTCRSRIDEGCGDGDRAVGHTLEIAEEWSFIVGAAEVEDGSAELDNQEKQEKNCEDHVGHSDSDNLKMRDNKLK